MRFIQRYFFLFISAISSFQGVTVPVLTTVSTSAVIISAVTIAPSQQAEAQIVINPYTYETQPATPLYETLGDVAAIWDATGLAVNTSNTYGEVDASGNLGALGWKSIAPGPVGRDMLPVQSSGETSGLSLQTINGINVIDCNGFARLRNTSGSANFNFLHYNATFANLKWTIHMLFRPGFGADPGEFYGFIGNNGTTLTAKGASLYYDDRNTSTDGFRHSISRGVTSSAISTSVDNNIITPNTWQVLTVEFDGSIATASERAKARINGVAVPITVTSASTAVVTTPTYDLEIFASGNGVGISTGQISHCVIQSRVESTAVRDAFINSLLPWRDALAPTNNSRLHIYNTFQEDLTRYYLTTSLSKSPTTGAIAQIFSESNNHYADDNRRISMRKSTDNRITWGAKTTVLHPAGTLCTGDLGAGYTSNGRLHLFADVHTVSGTSFAAPHSVTYMYSDNDGTSWTTVDLTSLLPADGLAAFRMYGDVVENAGVLMFPFYKLTNEGNFTESANYLLKISVAADPSVLGNWSVKTIRAKAATYINETSMAVVGPTNLIAIARNEVTLEWNAFDSSDNGETWTDRGAITFGEAFTAAAPVRLAQFMHNGVSITACYYPDRSANRLLKVIYGKTSSILSNVLTGFVNSSKRIVVPDFLHYGTVLHYDNDFNAIGSYSREVTTFPAEESRLVTFFLPTDHETAMEAALGL